ncbi:MAG: hypothetical protein WBL25_07045 [Anaerolineales bacterium]
MWPLWHRSFLNNRDALNSDRPYRKAWPHEEVVAYLQENAGSIFDPGVVLRTSPLFSVTFCELRKS